VTKLNSVCTLGIFSDIRISHQSGKVYFFPQRGRKTDSISLNNSETALRIVWSFEYTFIDVNKIPSFRTSAVDVFFSVNRYVLYPSCVPAESYTGHTSLTSGR
jgi:hypothetical protein